MEVHRVLAPKERERKGREEGEGTGRAAAAAAADQEGHSVAAAASADQDKVLGWRWRTLGGTGQEEELARLGTDPEEGKDRLAEVVEVLPAEEEGEEVLLQGTAAVAVAAAEEEEADRSRREGVAEAWQIPLWAEEGEERNRLDLAVEERREPGCGCHLGWEEEEGPVLDRVDRSRRTEVASARSPVQRWGKER